MNEAKHYALMAAGTLMMFGGIHILAAYGETISSVLYLALVCATLLGFIICLGLSMAGDDA